MRLSRPMNASRDESAPMAGAFVVTSPGGLTIEADESGERRILAGLAVPFDEVGFTSWGPTKFLPGSLASPVGIPLVRAHDEDQLIGIVTAGEPTDSGVPAKAKVSRVQAGEDALTLAADGALTGFSGSWRPTKYSFEADDEHGEVVVVEAADWRHLSTVTTPAFSSARITHVAASRQDASTPKEGTTVNLQQLLALLKAADASKRDGLLAEHAEFIRTQGLTAAQVLHLVELDAKVDEKAITPAPGGDAALSAAVAAFEKVGAQIEAGITKIAERPVEVSLAGGSAEPSHKFVNAGDYALHAARAQRVGHEQSEPSKALLSAALTTVGTGTNLGIVPPSYSSELIGNLPVATPVLDRLVRRSPLPATGMSIIKPLWDVLPVVAPHTENSQAPTGAVSIDPKTVSVLIAAHAVRASISLVERSDFGGFAQAYYEAAGISYLSWLESKALDTMITGAQVITPTGSSPVQVLMSAVGEVIENQKDGNDNLRGYVPNFVGVGWEFFAELADEDGPKFIGGSVDAGTLNGNVGGIQVYMLPGLDPDAILVGAQAATVVQAETEMQLRAMVVETMSIELGVMAHAAFDVEYPLALGYTATGS